MGELVSGEDSGLGWLGRVGLCLCLRDGKADGQRIGRRVTACAA